MEVQDRGSSGTSGSVEVQDQVEVQGSSGSSGNQIKRNIRSAEVQDQAEGDQDQGVTSQLAHL
jgi:hypothetical protein